MTTPDQHLAEAEQLLSRGEATTQAEAARAQAHTEFGYFAHQLQQARPTPADFRIHAMNHVVALRNGFWHPEKENPLELAAAVIAAARPIADWLQHGDTGAQPRQPEPGA